jgi:MFS family permease
MSIGDDAVRPRTVNPLSAIALAIVATLGALYVVSQFIRNSIGVIAPNLAVEMALTPLDLGFLSSIYFFVFAATQIPLGVALDRFGPKLCMLVCVGFTVLGCAMFAAAHSAGSLVVARALLGFGTASFLMAPCARFWPRHARRAACDGAAGFCHRSSRLARDVSRHRSGRGADRCGNLADRPGRSARRADRAAS